MADLPTQKYDIFFVTSLSLGSFLIEYIVCGGNLYNLVVFAMRKDFLLIICLSQMVNFLRVDGFL